jgi:hypothetical protein
MSSSSQGSYLFWGNVLTAGFTYVLWDYFGDLRFHAGGVVVSLMGDVALKGVKEQFGVYRERYVGRAKIGVREIERESDGADVISLGYLDSARDEYSSVVRVLDSVEPAYRSLGVSILNKVFCFALPSAAYAHLFFTALAVRDALSAMKGAGNDLEECIREAEKFRSWARERKEKLGGKNV